MSRMCGTEMGELCAVELSNSVHHGAVLSCLFAHNEHAQVRVTLYSGTILHQHIFTSHLCSQFFLTIPLGSLGHPACCCIYSTPAIDTLLSF